MNLDTSSLAPLLSRLENATIRLEELANQSASSNPSSAVSNESIAANTSQPASLTAFRAYLNGPVDTYVRKSKSMDGLVAEQAQLVEKALLKMESLIEIASKTQKQPSATVQRLFAPVQELIEQVVSLREHNRASPLFNHLSAVSEGIPALHWPLIESTPVSHVNEMKNSAQFYGNRVIKDFKEKDKSHVEWVSSWSACLTELMAYIEQCHKTGLTWNPKGSATVRADSVPSPEPASDPIGSAAGPALPVNTQALSLPSSQKQHINALFGELSRGEAITAGLKKVDKSQMTHKNSELRVSSIVKTDHHSTTPSASQPENLNKLDAKVRRPPKLELEGNKWCIENHEGHHNIIIAQPELKHVVYIYNCNHCIIQIKGKINAVTMDSCTRTALVIENAVSSIDVVHCRSGKLQVIGSSPTIILDKTDGFQIYYSRACAKNTQLLTAKCSEINILVPGKTNADDYIEKPVPEQFRTVITDSGELSTHFVQHAG